MWLASFTWFLVLIQLNVSWTIIWQGLTASGIPVNMQLIWCWNLLLGETNTWSFSICEACECFSINMFNKSEAIDAETLQWSCKIWLFWTKINVNGNYIGTAIPNCCRFHNQPCLQGSIFAGGFCQAEIKNTFNLRFVKCEVLKLNTFGTYRNQQIAKEPTESKPYKWTINKEQCCGKFG